MFRGSLSNAFTIKQPIPEVIKTQHGGFEQSKTPDVFVNVDLSLSQAFQ